MQTGYYQHIDGDIYYVQGKYKHVDRDTYFVICIDCYDNPIAIPYDDFIKKVRRNKKQHSAYTLIYEDSPQVTYYILADKEIDKYYGRIKDIMEEHEFTTIEMKSPTYKKYQYKEIKKAFMDYQISKYTSPEEQHRKEFAQQDIKDFMRSNLLDIIYFAKKYTEL